MQSKLFLYTTQNSLLMIVADKNVKLPFIVFS